MFSLACATLARIVSWPANYRTRLVKSPASTTRRNGGTIFYFSYPTWSVLEYSLDLSSLQGSCDGVQMEAPLILALFPLHSSLPHYRLSGVASMCSLRKKVSHRRNEPSTTSRWSNVLLPSQDICCSFPARVSRLTTNGRVGTGLMTKFVGQTSQVIGENEPRK